MTRNRAWAIGLGLLMIGVNLMGGSSPTRQRRYVDSFDAVWAAVISALQGRGYTILMTDKTTGVITTDFKVEENQESRHKYSILIGQDGGDTNLSISSTIQVQTTNHAIAAFSFGIVRPHDWEDRESDGTREDELFAAITNRLQPGGAAADTAQSNCRANFKARGSVVRGTTYETFEEIPRLSRDAAVDVVTSSVAGPLSLAGVDKAAGVINVQGKTAKGKTFTRDFAITSVAGGVRVNIVEKLPAGAHGNDDLTRDELCSIIVALSHAAPQPMPVSRATVSSPSAIPQAPSIEERLRQLDELYKKHLITEEEYNKKRSELLSQL